MNPHFFLKNSHKKIHSVKIRSHCRSSWNTKIALTHKGLDFHKNRPCSFHGAGYNRTGSAVRLSVQHKFRRIFNLLKTGSPHFKYTDLIGRTETVFYSPEDPIRRMTVTFKIKHCIYHMFQNSRTCYVSFFCHMTYNKNRNPKSFGDLHQYIRGFPDLRNTARRRTDILVKHSLNRVNNHHVRLLSLNYFPDSFQIRLTEYLQIFIKFSDPVGSETDLTQRLLPGNIKH